MDYDDVNLRPVGRLASKKEFQCSAVDCVG
jgi:hypothetical protein